MTHNQKIGLAVLVGALVIIGVIYLIYKTLTPENFTPQNGGGQTPTTTLIRVNAPLPNDSVHSPFTVRGEARGTWFFEASFPIELIDSTGRTVTTTFVQTQDNWMTEDFVPFEAVVYFSVPTSTSGELVLKKANPSGLPENDDRLNIPIIMQPSTTTTSSPTTTSTASQRLVRLFYYNPEKDKDAQGSILCSRNGLASLERRIPQTNSPIQDTIRLLLRGELTPQERNQGITTEYPLPGLKLETASLNNEGTLTLAFSDPQNRTSGGACRAGILWLQIQETALQFPEVKRVEFKPEELFQP